MEEGQIPINKLFFSTPQYLTGLETRLLDYTLGCRICTNNPVDRITDLYFVAGGAVLTFIILSIPAVDNFLYQELCNIWAVILIKAIIIFIVVFILDRIIVNWRKNNPLCEDH